MNSEYPIHQIITRRKRFEKLILSIMVATCMIMAGMWVVFDNPLQLEAFEPSIETIEIEIEIPVNITQFKYDRERLETLYTNLTLEWQDNWRNFSQELSYNVSYDDMYLAMNVSLNSKQVSTGMFSYRVAVDTSVTGEDYKEYGRVEEGMFRGLQIITFSVQRDLVADLPFMLFELNINFTDVELGILFTNTTIQLSYLDCIYTYSFSGVLLEYQNSKLGLISKSS